MNAPPRPEGASCGRSPRSKGRARPRGSARRGTIAVVTAPPIRVLLAKVGLDGHDRGVKVVAHAASPETVKAALRLGAWSVEHGYIMDEECLALFRERGAWYIPTLGITHMTPGQAKTPWEHRWLEQRGLTPDLIARAEGAVDEHRRWFREALRSGVKMALGSDLRPLKDAALLVNSTNLGMAGQAPLEIDLAKLPASAVVYDIVYVPLMTELLKAAQQRGNRIVDGIGMLLHQGRPGFKAWFGPDPQVTDALRSFVLGG